MSINYGSLSWRNIVESGKFGFFFLFFFSSESTFKSLYQGTATCSSKPILNAAHLISIFKRKLAVLSRKHLGKNDSVAVVIYVSGSPLHCHFKDPCWHNIQWQW